MLGVNQGSKDIVKRMLLKGVNRHVRDGQGQEAIDMARGLGRTEMVKVLND